MPGSFYRKRRNEKKLLQELGDLGARPRSASDLLCDHREVKSLSGTQFSIYKQEDGLTRRGLSVPKYSQYLIIIASP